MKFPALEHMLDLVESQIIELRHAEAALTIKDFSSGLLIVCTENLNPNVVVMKAAKDRV